LFFFSKEAEMPAVAAISLRDSTLTSHSFVPVTRASDGTWWFEESASAGTLGVARLSLKLQKTPVATVGTQASSDRVNRVKWSFHTPSLETLGTSDSGLVPPPTVAYVERANGEFILPERGTKVRRQDIRTYIYDLMNVGAFQALVDDLADLY
jgi:hypothetical protein